MIFQRRELQDYLLFSSFLIFSPRFLKNSAVCKNTHIITGKIIFTANAAKNIVVACGLPENAATSITTTDANKTTIHNKANTLFIYKSFPPLSIFYYKLIFYFYENNYIPIIIWRATSSSIGVANTPSSNSTTSPIPFWITNLKRPFLTFLSV